MALSRTHRVAVVGVSLLMLVAFVGLCGDSCRHRFIWNASPSFPTGLYQLHPDENVQRGDLVYFDEPTVALQLARARGYMPPRGHFLKIADGFPGDTYCILFLTPNLHLFTLRGEPRGLVETHDSQGRPLPVLRGCHEVPDGHFLPTAPEPRSFDGRYFGTAPITAIRGVARPIYLQDKQE